MELLNLQGSSGVSLPCPYATVWGCIALGWGRDWCKALGQAIPGTHTDTEDLVFSPTRLERPPTMGHWTESPEGIALEVKLVPDERLLGTFCKKA